ncbi:meiosis protein SPO22/ZIP4 like-domain-containing protein [Pisolithus thermaeus]|nr:meiosis protein SPO22/ZIP4 like-domain-containing protein [Pisolithus thermaeus]
MGARIESFTIEYTPFFSAEISIKIKPKLKNIPSSTSIDTASVVKDLHQIASLAKSFSDQRLKLGDDAHLADLLDQQGVNLWNASGLFRQDSDSRLIVAALRLAGFRLMEAGLESEPSIQALLHMLQVASKAGSALSEVGNSEAAASVLTCAAKFEEALRNHSDPDRAHEHSKARVTTLYFSSRMEAAWREKNEGLAMFMADKITGLDPGRNRRELLATKLLDIGKSILRACHQGGKLVVEGNRAPDALRWMQKAFQVIEPLECSPNSELAELKRAVLRSLARGYFLASSHDPENLTRAEVALEEIISTIDPSVDHTSSEYQQLRWMKLAVVKRRKAGDIELLQALESIIDNMTFSDSDLSDILMELRSLSPQYDVVTSTIKRCLWRALDTSASISCIEKLLISLLFHCSKGDDHTKAMKNLEESFQEVVKSDIELSKAAASACLTLIWQYGDRHYHASRWLEAADWFICGTNAVFSGLGPSCTSKCLRKAALCYIQQKEYARAASAVKRCPVNGATTRYVVFLIAVHQGLYSIRLHALLEMVEAADFDRKMLLLACRLAHDSDMKSLLLSVLMALSDTLNFRNDVENLAEAMVLIRCIIRLTLKLLGQPGANIPPLVKTLLNYFKNAKTLVEAVACENVALVIRDLSWLWRTAYNCAIDGCSNWDNHGEEVSSAFDISRQLLELYIAKTLTEVEPSTYVYIANASFAATSGRVILVRERLSGTDAQPEILRNLSAEIKSCTGRIASLLDKVPPADRSHLQSFLHFLRVFHVESASHLGEWQTILETIEEATRDEHQSLVTYEAIGDVLWENKNCPINGMMQLLYAALEAILHACLAHSQLSLDKFSRWLRSICSILLAKGSGADRSKAIQYFDQANAVLEEHGDLAENGNPLYPADERLWLLSTAYNTGVECLHASLVDEARRWFECATVFCRFVPNGKARAEKISETYTDLLARYTRG